MCVGEDPIWRSTVSGLLPGEGNRAEAEQASKGLQ